MSFGPQQQNRRPSPFGGAGFSMFPPGIKFLLISNAGIFLFEIFFGKFYLGSSGKLNDLIDMYFPLWPIDTGYFRVWQFFTYMFLHANFFHILMNMFMLWMLGIELEQLWGTKKFLIYYAACGLGGGVAHLILSSFFGLPSGPLVGASGAIFGVMMAFWFLFPDRYVLIWGVLPVKTKILIPILVAFEVYSLSGGSGDNVAHLAHLGGALTGLIYLLISTGGRLFSLRRDHRAGEPVWRGASAPHNGNGNSGGIFGGRTPFRGKPNAVDAEYQDLDRGHEQPRTAADVKQARVITQDEIDRILDKIAATGYQNLTEEERDILFEASRRMEERR
jgi:membrane associated rhomboid family serine protease